MTRGALIFAFNNGVIDYTRLAAWTAGNVKRHLDIPVALITDLHVNDPAFDVVISADKVKGNGKFFADFGETRDWYNLNRVDAYDLSPWDETLVLDADYIVASDQLRVLFESGQEFLAHRSADDITGNDFSEADYFGRNKMPMWWATVMYFQRNKTARLIFDAMKMIRDNWQHYCDLFGCRHGPFRNDYALSIALNIINGHTQPMEIPWPLLNLMPNQKLTQIDIDSYKIHFNDGEGRPKWIDICGQDVHAMGKRNLEAIIGNQI